MTITNDLSVKIGKGGFGYVYRGELEETHKVVAVKVNSEESEQGDREFWNEVYIYTYIYAQPLRIINSFGRVTP